MGEEENREGEEDVDTLLTLSCIDRAHARETRKLQCETPAEHPPPPATHYWCMCSIRVHVRDSAGDVGAIKEHFCSAGRCDDSFMSVSELEGEPRGRQG